MFVRIPPGYCLGSWGQICRAAKSNRCTSIQTRPHQDELGGKIRRPRPAVNVPVRPFGGEKCAAANDAESGASVAAYAFRPMPHVAAQVMAAKWRFARWKG